MAGSKRLDYLVDQDTSDYWNLPKETGEDAVIEPYLYEGTLLTSYTSPINRDGAFAAIGGVDVSLASLHGEIAKLKILDSDYGFLVSNGGIFVSAPNEKLIDTTTLTKPADEKGNADLRAAAEAIAAGKGGQVETTDPFTGKRILLSWAPVTTGDWGFLTAVPVDEVLAPIDAMRNGLLLIGLILLLVAAGAPSPCSPHA